MKVYGYIENDNDDPVALVLNGRSRRLIIAETPEALCRRAYEVITEAVIDSLHDNSLHDREIWVLRAFLAEEPIEVNPSDDTVTNWLDAYRQSDARAHRFTMIGPDEVIDLTADAEQP